MRCAPAVVLWANITVGQSHRQLDVLPDVVGYAVVVRETPTETRYYVFDARTLRNRLMASNAQDVLAESLRIDEYTASNAGQLDDVSDAGSVVLEGHQVIGVIAENGRRGRRGHLPGSDLPDVDEFVTRGTDLTIAGPTFAEGVDDEVGDDAPRLFRSYPHARAPAQVGLGDVFTLDVGFSGAAPIHSVGRAEPVFVLGPSRLEFIVQVAGFGFTFPDGVETTLVVDRDHPEAMRKPIRVHANPDEDPAQRILEVSYEYDGAVVGRTWVEILVVAADPASGEDAATGSAGAPPAMSPDDTPHLSLDVISKQGVPSVKFRFHCPYPDVERPRDDVSVDLDQDSAQSFAVQIMQLIPAATPDTFLAETIRGAAEVVAGALPEEFWPIFVETWKRANAAGEVPRMLLTTSEPWIPWELAWVDPDLLGDDAATLLGPEFAEGSTLGELWEVARWAMPTRLRPTIVPATPPVSTLDATKIAVLIGNYQNESEVNPLPSAEEEGKTIAMAYDGLPLDVSTEDVTTLLRCRTQRDGLPFLPTVIHFAGHGETDVNNPQFTGLLLTGGHRLNPIVIRGFTLLKEKRPFVFLNACEAGVAGETLSQLGGLVGAFLAKGASGFIAPLWKVDDGAAHDIAVAFYKSVLVDGKTVGAAVRDIRRRYTPNSSSATALAYVFYGNPNLKLERGVA